ncbi:LytTR family DNA-binding domain-containing protein [Zhouia amylolytica]|uniref:HTH LytTR-type domain-containing protein n=1 Tax=Zhouia amylolytica AD3 TaxID=1286632 RepID=W2UL58_9FLAO|nr:LytTR family DNA-binding domain-containing protein [Zhouia amylolytica]ETN94067.1 hypothetical protein P278_28710 [Zhouia amylolytica AD3]
MNSVLQMPFNYLASSKSKLTYVITSSLFTQVFLLLFQPYGLHTEIINPENTTLSIILFFQGIMVSTFLGLSLSQFILRPLFNFIQVSIKKYALWFLFEAVLITMMYFALSFFIPDLGNDFERELDVLFQLKNIFRAIVLLLFPFMFCIVYENIQNLSKEIRELESQLIHYKKNIRKNLSVETLNIEDENKNTELSIRLEQFLYAEASNQYVLIHYVLNNELKKRIIRTRLKNLEESFEMLPIKRCHRSYLVNLMNVNYLQKKGSAYVIIIENIQKISIPVSKSYLALIKGEINL